MHRHVAQVCNSALSWKPDVQNAEALFLAGFAAFEFGRTSPQLLGVKICLEDQTYSHCISPQLRNVHLG